MRMRNIFWFMLCLSVMMLIWLSAGVAYSQSSTNYAITWDVLEGGGGKSHSANYIILASIGQATAIGESSGSQYTNYAGFEIGGNSNISDFVILTVDDSEGKPGFTDIPVTIALDNSATPVSSLQFRLTYDATIGIHAIGGSTGYQLTSRTQDFTASMTVTENGADSEILVLLYNLSGGEISAGTGPILELFFNVDAVAVPGDTSHLQFTESIVADASAQPLLSDHVDTATFTIIDPCDAGDINCDGTIDVLDLQTLLNCITSSGSCERCDLNGDGQYNIFDVQLLINMINNIPAPTAVPSAGNKPAVSGSNVVTLPDIRLQQGATGTFGVSLTNSDAVAAGQLTLNYDSTTGFDITDVNLTSRTSEFYEPIVFHKDTSDPANAKVLVLYFSLTGATINPGSDDILEFTYQTTPDASGAVNLRLTDTLLANQNGESAGYVMTDNGSVVIEEPLYYTITALVWEGGSITPNGVTPVCEGTSQTFVIIPDEGYQIADVLVDGISAGAVSEYTFTNITTDHIIEALFTPVSSGGSFLRNDTRDVNKSLTNPDDDWMCWAAAAANILDWTGWAQPFFDSAVDIFYTFQDYWTNAGGLMEYAWHWWFDGTEPPDWPGWAQLNEGWAETEDGGAYRSDYNFFDYFYEDWAIWDPDSGQWKWGT